MAPTKCPTCGGLRANIIDPSTLPTHPIDPRATVAANLGKLILDQLPYGSAIAFPPPAGTAPTNTFVPIPSGYKAANPVEMDGLYVENHAEDPFKPDHPATNGDIADIDTMLLDGKLHYWEMKCSPHQVTKAMRIWYTYRQAYMDEDVEKERIVGTWLLIGYVGDRALIEATLDSPPGVPSKNLAGGARRPESRVGRRTWHQGGNSG